MPTSMPRRNASKLNYWQIARGAAITVCVAFLVFRLFIQRPVPKLPPAPLEQIVVGSTLPPAIMERLDTVGWSKRAGDQLAIWVSAYWQRVIVIQDRVAVVIYPCSTAARGLGNREGSYQTPLGWHEIAERIGDGLPSGAVLIERKHNGKIWTPDQVTEKDFVLTRIMWLRGLEPGVNAGGNVDSHDRFIYIHGTPAEGRIGSPASLGCVRMNNVDVIDLYSRTRTGTPVLISEW